MIKDFSLNSLNSLNSFNSQLRRWSQRKKIRGVRGVRVVRGALKVFSCGDSEGHHGATGLRVVKGY